jgi:hypothetical protein|nr:hypothetical protein [uncultured Sediminibacterium sp.]
MLALKIFRILTYVLVPIACFFGLLDLLLLIPAMANPAMWLMLFLFAGIVIYTFSSLKFLRSGIERNARCKPSLKDWVKVNAYVSLALGSMFLVNSIGILSLGPVALNDLVTQMIDSQPNLPKGMDPDLLVSMLKGVAGFMLVTSVIILTHVILGLSMLKKFAHLFMPPAQQ